MLKVRKDNDGSCTVSLPKDDALLFEVLPQRLRSLLDQPDFSNRMAQRLFPPAYRDDPDREAEYRRLLGDDLAQRKREHIRAFERTLEDCTRTGQRVEIHIEASEYELWLGFVNDMRLMLAVELGIEEEGWGEHFDPTHPKAGEMALLHHLSWLQEELLAA